MIYFISWYLIYETNSMNNAKYFIPLFVLILLIPSSLVYAESTGVDDKTNNENPHTLGDTTGSVGNTLLDITTLGIIQDTSRNY